MLKVYKYRIHPSRAQVTTIEATLALCCELYNAALQERRDAWRIARKSVSCVEQTNQLPGIKLIRPEFSTVHSQVLQDVLRRLDKAFDAFFRRVKAGEKRAGFPRFRSRARYDSFTYPQAGFAIESGKLRLSKIGNLKIKQHRPILGKIKMLTIMRTPTDKWFACFSVECEPEPLPPSTEATGVDCGLKEFAVLSNGEPIHNPRFFRAQEKRLVKAQKRLSVAAKGNPERRKQRKIVAHLHEHIANQRRNFAHQESRKLVNRYGIIIFESLNISGMLKNHGFAKSIADAAWNQLVQMTTYKAASAGRCVVQVNPRNTSQICSGCGEMVEKGLSVRVHRCAGCGLVLDRDHNAARNILRLGLQSLGMPTGTGHRSHVISDAEQSLSSKRRGA
ncbi:MAG TPA: transposase [Blastocatellia bacterium]|nr:transposase [Blastocatellia bacterium]